MIAFVTLFLGLVYGPVTVELSAAPGVARIELSVDGEIVAELEAPWTARLDLGPEIAPHELVAVAKDAEGRRVGEVRQWINRPRPGAEASFVVEKGASGTGRAARLHWHSVTGSRPKSIRVSFDGQPLEVPDPNRIPLPAHSPGTTHILVADVEFEDGLAATAVASLGGEKLDEALEELTAVAIRLGRGARLPKDGRLDGWFRSGEKPLKVAAVEEGPSEVVFVVAGEALDDLRSLLPDSSRSQVAIAAAERIDLPRGTRYRFLGTVPKTFDSPTEVVSLFAASEDFTPSDGSFFRVVGRLTIAKRPEDPRVAESVAVAGLSAAARSRRRAVVLLLGSGAAEEGLVEAPQTRRFLSRLGVPLHVWDVSRPPAGAAPDLPPSAADLADVRPHWPEAVRITDLSSLLSAFRGVEKELSSQRIVWLHGRLNPANVELTAAAGKEVALVP
ncbi:MAG: hypothetical protein ACYDBY_17775 [Thermoanaerobaculia bacterium]